MDYDTLAKAAGFTDANDLLDHTTKLALAFAEAGRASGLHPAFVLDATLRFMASSMFAIAQVADHGNGFDEFRLLAHRALDGYLNNIVSDHLAATSAGEA